MEISSTPAGTRAATTELTRPEDVFAPSKNASKEEERQLFTDFVGQTFYGQMLSAMRKTVGKPAYLHGGRAEEVFQGQLDQTLAEELSKATAETFAEPMYELFSLPRR